MALFEKNFASRENPYRRRRKSKRNHEFCFFIWLFREDVNKLCSASKPNQTQNIWTVNTLKAILFLFSAIFFDFVFKLNLFLFGCCDGRKWQVHDETLLIGFFSVLPLDYFLPPIINPTLGISLANGFIP